VTAPAIVIELLLGGSWVSITSKVRMPAGITVTRGRNNEASDPDPGTLAFTVDNSDGRFTIGNTAGVYGANFKRWVQCRYTVNGSVRFVGYVQAAPVAWNGTTRALSDVTISCVDALATMAMSPNLRSWASALIGALTPTYWWTLGDAEGSVNAAPSAGPATLTGTFYPDPGGTTHTLSELLTFGTDGPAQMESDVVAKITRPDDLSTASLQATPLTVAMPYTFCAIYTPDEFGPNTNTRLLGIWTVSSSYLLHVLRNGDSLIFEDFGNGVTITVPHYFTMGVPALVAVSVTAGVSTLLGSGRTIPYAAGGTMTLGVGPASGTYSQAAIIPGAMSESTFAALKAKLIGDGSGPVLDWIQRAASEAGVPTAATATFNRTMQRPELKGSNPAEIGNTLAAAAGAVFVAQRDGAPRWVDPTHCPAAVALDAHDFAGPMAWDADQSLYYTEVQVDDVLRQAADVDQFPKTARNIKGLLPDADLTAYVDWLAVTAGVWGGHRVSGISVNLWPMDSTKTAAYLGLDVRSRASISNAPDQIPTPMVVTIEGYTETVNDKAWTLSFNTAPDPRFVLDEPAAELDSAYRLYT